MRKLYEQFAFNVSRGPAYEAEDALPAQPVERPPVRYLAYYLPQFHAVPENDEWWGKGFTEWTNVTRALPRYVGHYQPRLPGALGFYDLRDESVLREQAKLAKRAGVYGFCIHHYWFSGRRILERPLEILLANRDIDLPFCLNWANENWSRRWDGLEDDILLEQRYAPDDAVRFAESILPAVEDARYIRIGGRPLIMLYRPRLVPDARKAVDAWRSVFAREGVGDPYVVMAQLSEAEDPRKYGMDAAAGFPPHLAWRLPNHRNRVELLDRSFEGRVMSYDALAQRLRENRPEEFRLFPGVCPQWDNEARKPGRGSGFYGSTPAKYGEWLRAASEQALRPADPDERIVFVNAWNEWAEGAYLEPDRHYGFAWLAETRRALDSIGQNRQGDRTVETRTCRYQSPTLSFRRAVINRLRRLPSRLKGE